jgi:hypothetical protein
MTDMTGSRAEAALRIARPSIASLFIAPTQGKDDLATGTGFLVERNGKTYLLTNWHVVTGVNPETRELLDPHGRKPEALRILHNRDGQLGMWIEKREPLYDEGGNRLWCEHPLFPDGSVDAVALPLTDLGDTAVYAHDPWVTTGPTFAPSEPVNIIGFPFGLTGGSDGYYAIWTRGAVASEPEVDYDNRPCFLVDARTRRGQSGSPVILYATGAYHDKGTVVATDEPTERLVGIYSGRVTEESDLGFVWKAEALRAITESGV